MANYHAAVSARVEQYVESVLERLRFNLANDLPLTMGENPGAFLAWMGLPARDERADRVARWGSLAGPLAAANRARMVEQRRLARLAKRMGALP